MQPNRRAVRLDPDPPPALTLVVLAAGRSSRFERLKQLVPIGPSGEAFLDYALYDGALAGFARFLLVIEESRRADFDAHLRDAAAAGLDVRYAYQRTAHAGLVENPPPGRDRPWGTGFAVLAAGDQIDGPFAVCNADDFYGRGAYATLAAAMRGYAAGPVDPSRRGEKDAADLVDAAEPVDRSERRDATGPAAGHERRSTPARAAPPRPTPAVAIGYSLEVTLSEGGGVSRGLCELDDEGTLLRLTEGLELRRRGERVHGRDAAGGRIDVPLRTPVCANLWGFQPDILPLLRERFAAFLASGPGLRREFYLSEAMNDLVEAGLARGAVIPTREPWMGVTFPEDHEGVAKSVRKLVDSGMYPESLWRSVPVPP